MLIVQTDASDTGLAGVILQFDSDGFEHPITYASKKLTKTESNYSMYKVLKTNTLVPM
jgi:hypothetical protein